MFTNADPFQIGALPKTFYYPSREKELTKQEKKVCLSAPGDSKDTQKQVSSPEDLKFLKETNTLKALEVPTRENGSFAEQSSTSLFNESWPSTERSGSLGTPLSDGTVSTPEMSQQMREWLEGQDKPPGSSTLGWFINRFRRAPPTDRQHRDKLAFRSQNPADFWWLSPPNGQSTPLVTPPQKLQRSPKKSPSPNAKKRGKSASSFSSPAVHSSDSATAELERRARELVERSETSIESVSTEPFPLPLKKPGNTKHPPQPKAKPSSYSGQPRSPPTKSTIPDRITAVRHQNPWPEDDILYKWRLARKMEKAQEKATGINVRMPVPKPSSHSMRSQPVISTAPYVTPGIIDTMQSISGLSTIPDPSELERLLHEESLSTKIPRSQVHTRTSLPTSVESGPGISSPDRWSGAPVIMVTSRNASARPMPTPVISPPCRHLETRTMGNSDIYNKEVCPHMHLACDILPCPCAKDDAIMNHLHHDTQRNDEKGNRHFSEKIPDSTSKEPGSCCAKENKEIEILLKRNSARPSPDKQGIVADAKQIIHSKKPISKSSPESSPSSVEEQEPRISSKERKKRTSRTKDNKKTHENARKSASEMVDNVIGKVISDHLFTGDEPSTSTDEEIPRTSYQSSNQSDPRQTHINKVLEERADSLPLPQRDESSDDEFPDDEILKMLRLRSKDLERELRQIDSFLEQDK